MSFIKLSKVGYRLPDRDLFSGLTVAFGRGRQALVGWNGVGKSTLAKLIAGDLEPDDGDIQRSGQVFYFAQSVASRRLVSDETEVSFTDRMARLRAELGKHDSSSRSEIWLQKIPVRESLENLSGGEFMRLRFLEMWARVLVSEAEGNETFIVLDEPTNDLDREGRDFISEWLSLRPDGVLLISHDRELLENVDEIFELSNLGLKRYAGGYSNFKDRSEDERERNASAIRDLDRDLKRKNREKNEKQERQDKRMRRGQAQADAGGLPRILLGGRKRRAQETAGRIDSAESDRVREAKRELVEAQGERRLDPFIRLSFEGEARSASQVLLTVENLKLADETGWREPLNFQLKAQDRLRVRGPNGVGKSSLLRILMGQGRPYEGTVWRAGLLDDVDRIGFLDQTQSVLIQGETVLETISKASRFGIGEIRNELAFYGFTGESVHLKVESLSGGERLRLALARIFLGRKLPAMLVLDEPTNNLDFRSIEFLERAIEGFPGGVLLVSHDEVFLDSLKHFSDLELSVS